MTIDVLAVIIHNYDQTRNASAAASLAAMNDDSGFLSITGMQWIGWQPTLIPPSLLSHLRKHWTTFNHRLRWARHLRLGKLLFRADLASSYSLVRGILDFSPKISRRGLKTSIEIELSRKHIRAWESFMDSKNEWLLVVEDDIRYQARNNKALKYVAVFAKEHEASPCFISLSAPYSLSQISIKNVLGEQREDYVTLLVGSTNTTSAYMANRQMIEFAINTVRRSPSYSKLNSDLMINSIFVKAAKVSRPVQCMHLRSEIFMNGSLAGVFPSTIA